MKLPQKWERYHCRQIKHLEEANGATVGADAQGRLGEE
jgi:hypothetical protein